MKTGLLLPHFGAQASGDKIIAGAIRAEQLGFDSVWVRDHIAFTPHGEFEDPNPNFFEAFTVLAAVGAVTTRLQLGTGAMIPFRHPLLTALTAATITQLAGPRLILGVGSGNFDAEFAAVGLGGVPRVELVTETIAVMRQLWSGKLVSWHGEHYQFDDVTMAPGPAGGTVPIWYCGNTPQSVRLAVQHCEGWMPGRIGIDTLRQRVANMRQLTAVSGLPPLTIGIIPSASVDVSRERALARVNVEGLLTWANKARYWQKPASGAFRDVADLDGVLLYGTPDDVTEQCLRLRDAGANHVVFDFRMSFGRWEEQMEVIGTHVLPRLGST
jgi:alkanesulfonate monooxygenase SsuD/methylene tetrahydromethanopterin reductase-like flavin-dependent oxidoreductase (luciferase family)